MNTCQTRERSEVYLVLSLRNDIKIVAKVRDCTELKKDTGASLWKNIVLISILLVSSDRKYNTQLEKGMS